MEELAVGKIIHRGRVPLYFYKPPVYVIDWRCEHDGRPYGIIEVEEYYGEPPEDIEERLVLTVNSLYEEGKLFS